MQNVTQRETSDEWQTAPTGIALGILLSLPLWSAVIALGRWLI